MASRERARAEADRGAGAEALVPRLRRSCRENAGDYDGSYQVNLGD
ncbi:hypothetical protein ACFYRL_34050 [Streptomyces goshikiensis]